MAEFPALPLWTDAFVGDTTHLSCELVGAYLLLLFAAWRSPHCDLPDDDRFLAQITRCDVRTWRKRYRPALAPFHTIKDGRWTQKRLHKERNRVADLSRNMRENALRRWNKNKDIADATAMPKQCNGNATIPITIEEDKKDKRVRATRWHPDAAITIDWLDHALIARRRNMLPDIDLMLEAERFTNFWASKSGANATKLDWHKTWINWALKAEAPRHGQGKQSAHDKFFAGVADAIRDTLEPPSEGGDNVIVGPFGRPLLPP